MSKAEIVGAWVGYYVTYFAFLALGVWGVSISVPRVVADPGSYWGWATAILSILVIVDINKTTARKTVNNILKKESK